MKITFNTSGLRGVYQEIAKKIEDADRRFRRSYEGRPVAEVKPRVRAAFAAVGVNLGESHIAEYAAAVSAREPFKWVLK